MRPHAWAWLALSSFLLATSTAATRPRYGGTLTLELSASWTTLDSAVPLVAETLVRLNQKGDVEPGIAVAWQHDADRKRWRFALRPKTFFHDGEPLTAASAAPSLAAALKKRYSDATLTQGGQTLVIQFSHSVPDLLAALAQPRMAISRASDTHPLIGTGAFRLAAWDPGRRLTLAAFEDYWGGRPFLDSVVINLGATRAIGDVFDIPFAQTRRVVPERTQVSTSPAHELIALVGDKVAPEVWQALSLSIDRMPIVNVLSQKRAEPAFGLLPNWLGGYAFLFANQPDVERAKRLLAGLRVTPLSLSYPSNDSFARSVAERLALNARDAGVILQPVPGPGGNVRVARWPVDSRDAGAELKKFAGLLGLSESATSPNPAKPETLYEAERALLDAHRVIPLVYLPDVYGVSPRVHNWEAGLTLHLENVWVEP